MQIIFKMVNQKLFEEKLIECLMSFTLNFLKRIKSFPLSLEKIKVDDK